MALGHPVWTTPPPFDLGTNSTTWNLGQLIPISTFSVRLSISVCTSLALALFPSALFPKLVKVPSSWLSSALTSKGL